MKPPKFDYRDPATLQEALGLLQQYGDEAKVLAGGQSLMPLMNMRLVRPAVILDINRLSELAYISPTAEGGLAIGGLTRQRTVEQSSLVRERNPLLAAAVPYIGHSQIRNRGTIGGSLAHADPAAELCAVSLALEAEVVLTSNGTQRVVRAADLFVSYYATEMEPTELLTEIRIPAWPTGWGWGFEEVSRRSGDFALVGAATLIQLDGEQLCRGIRITLFGIGGTPMRMQTAETALLGRRVDDAALQEIGGMVSQELDPDSDVHASAEYRREVGGVLVRRSLGAALARAKGGPAA